VITVGNTAVPPHLTRCEAIVGELVTSTATLTVVSVPVSGAAVASGRGYTLTQPGVYEFTDGDRDIEILAFEPACLGSVVIPDMQGTGRTAARTATERRLILRNYALHGAVRTGRADDIRTAHDWTSFVR
jgi:hypothetical protein